MLQSDEEFAASFKDQESKSALRKKHITQLRSSLREKLVNSDFKTILQKLIENRGKVDVGFKYVTESHYEQHGLQLAEQYYFTKLNKMIYNNTKTVYQRHPPSQSMCETIRINFRDTAKGLATLASNVKLTLPKFLLSDQASLQALLKALSFNSVNIKPINKFARDIRGTIMIHFASLNGFKYIAQYHTILLKMQAEIESQLKSLEESTEVSEGQNVLVRLIVNEVHDSIVITQNILTQIIQQKGQDSNVTKIYYMSDVKEDSDPVEYTNMEHFFANLYNQFLTIIANWQNENNDFAQMI